MRLHTLLALILVLCFSCDFGSSTNNENNQTVETTSKDWICIPHKKVGLITKDATEKAIKYVYGEKQTKRQEIGLGEGEMTMGTIVFPNTSEELIVEWTVEDPYKTISRIRIEKEATKWKSKEGITIGTSLEELIKLNGKDFSFYGFEWDYSGSLNSWEGGKINPDLKVVLTPDNPAAIFPALIGELSFSSNHPKAKAAKLKVSALIIEMAKNSTDN